MLLFCISITPPLILKISLFSLSIFTLISPFVNVEIIAA